MSIVENVTSMTRLPSATSATEYSASSSLSVCPTDGISSTANLWHLPVYGPLPAVLRQTLEIAISLENAALDTGLSRMEFQTRISASRMLEDKGLFALPLRCPADDEAVDFSYLGRAGIALFLLRGPPSAFAGARLLGFHGGAPIEDVQIGDHFRFLTPSHFIEPMEDLLILGRQMEGSLPGSTAYQKRNRKSMEEDEGVQAASGDHDSQGEKCSNYMLIDSEGRPHSTRIKTDMVVREQDLAVLFRVTESDRWLYAMGQEFILQVREYQDMILMDYSLR